jgi:hypothetical protein
VRAQAEENAREDLVQALARQTIGAERMGELTPDITRRLAAQIRSEMIVNRSAERIGKDYRITLAARVDSAWFQSLLDNEGIISSSERAGGVTQPIFVMLDENTGPARDYQKPQEVVTEYDRNAGASFSDKSVAAYSQKDRAGQSYHGATADRVTGSDAAGYSDAYGSAAERSRGSASSATSVGAASASSNSVAAIDKTNVQADEHDVQRYRQRITFQTSSLTGPAQVARPALGSALRGYGVEMAASEIELSSYFRGTPPTYSQLKASVQFKPFLGDLAQRNVAPFFMGGTISLQDAGRDAATGQPTCTGSLAASAFATGNSYMIAEGTAVATATGATYEDCAAKLSKTLAQQAATDIGPQVQNYWRKELRGQARIVAASASGQADYTLTVRAVRLDMAMQADVLDALGSIAGVQSQVFLGQTGKQVSFQVRYNGQLPLQMALYLKLRSNPAFAQMQPTTQGQNVVLCLSGC